MIEYYNWKQEEAVLVIIRNIVNNLLIPLKGFYSKYPIKPEQRSFEGDAIGSLTGDLVGNWYSSTDIGCAFIMLDGATHAYQLLELPELKELIDEMIAKFLEIDFLGISIQTHATLSDRKSVV